MQLEQQQIQTIAQVHLFSCKMNAKQQLYKLEVRSPEHTPLSTPTKSVRALKGNFNSVDCYRKIKFTAV